MTDKQKLEAIETYLKWDANTEEGALKILDNIWWVVIEGRLKPNESK